MRFSAFVASLACLFGAAKAANDEILIFGCRDEDCNDCMDTSSGSIKKEFGKYDNCWEAGSGTFKSAKVKAAGPDDGGAIRAFWAEQGTVPCGHQDPRDGCSTTMVYAGREACLHFMHPNGVWPSQVSIHYGEDCYP